MLSAGHLGHAASERPRAARRRRWFFWSVSLSVLLLDQASKLWALWALTNTVENMPVGATWGSYAERLWSRVHPQHRASVTVIESCFHFRYVENPGAAWGFLSSTSSAWRTPFFLALSLSAMAFILLYLRRVPVRQRLLHWGLTLVFGGACGNFIDRIRLGYVIDFIDWHVADYYTWPTFNVADAAISVGVVLLLIDTLAESRRG